MKITLTATFCILISIAFLQVSQAEVITSYSTPGGPAQLNGSIEIGQSITTPNTIPHAQITFNFYGSGSNPFTEGDPIAGGEMFLLTQLYQGVADDLSTSTPGFLAVTDSIQADGIGTEWVFDPGLILRPNTSYYFYARNVPSIGKALTQNNPYPGGAYYQALNGTGTTFGPSGQNDWHFELEGTPVPEPSTLCLCLLLGIGGAFNARKRRKYRESLAGSRKSIPLF